MDEEEEDPAIASCPEPAVTPLRPDCTLTADCESLNEAVIGIITLEFAGRDKKKEKNKRYRLKSVVIRFRWATLAATHQESNA